MRIGGGLHLPGVRWRIEDQTADALNCNAAEIGASVLLAEGFFARAEVNFVGARIGGQLACNGGRFDAETGIALDCEAAEIGADVFLTDGVRARALVDCTRARIAGNLRLWGGRISRGSGRKLFCPQTE